MRCSISVTSQYCKQKTDYLESKAYMFICSLRASPFQFTVFSLYGWWTVNTVYDDSMTRRPVSSHSIIIKSGLGHQE
jgi:hypothetical protein